MRKIIIYIVVCVIAITGCTNNNSISIDSAKDISKELVLSEDALSGIDVREHILPIPQNGEIGDEAVFGDIIYYSVLYMENMSNYANRVEIYSYNTENKDTNKIYEYKNFNDLFYLNELKATDDKLYWNMISSDGIGWEIYEFDLISMQTKAIHSSNVSNPINIPSLTISNQLLAWYEIYKGDAYDEVSLVIYSFETREVESNNDQIHLFSPYDRAFIRDDFLTYLTLNEDNIIVNVWDTINGNIQELEFEIGTRILNIRSNGEITVWHENYGESDVYVYDHISNELYLISSEDDATRIFSIDLFDDFVLINDKKTKKIYGVNIINKKIFDFTREIQGVTSNYIMSGISADNQFKTVNKTSENEIFCLVFEYR